MYCVCEGRKMNSGQGNYEWVGVNGGGECSNNKVLTGGHFSVLVCMTS